MDIKGTFGGERLGYRYHGGARGLLGGREEDGDFVKGRDTRGGLVTSCLALAPGSGWRVLCCLP